MASVRVAWTLEASILSSGVVADHVLVSLGGAVADMVATVRETGVVFAEVPAGAYIASVQRIALDSSPIGAARRTTPFTVHEEMTMLMLYVGRVGAP